MRFQYTYRNTAKDLWQLSMYYTYGSMVGVCNIIFTVAIIALAYSRWSTSTMWMKILMAGCFGLFTVFQPFMTWIKAKKQASHIVEDTFLGIGDKEIYVKSGTECSRVQWRNIKKVSRKGNILVIFSDTTHGYILNKRIVGNEFEDLSKFVISKVNINK